MRKRRRREKGGASEASGPAPQPKRPVITLIEYDASSYEERRVETIEAVFACRDSGKVSWINIDGLEEPEMIRKLGEHFGLHPLAIEDVMHTVQRPKLEEYDDYLFLVAQMAYSRGPFHVEFEQVSFFVGKNFVITIQEDRDRDVFEPVRTRLRNGRGFARSRGHDYLTYALIDAVIDHFFPVLEPIGEAVEDLEDELLERPTRECIVQLHELKRVLLELRRNTWPMRELVGALIRDESGFMTKETAVFLRDCYDHCIQIMDVIESYRDLSASMMDIYLSSLGIRTNEIMRVLTVVSTIFIPLTFIVGVYGMNFENMPELRSPYGYYACLGFMALLAGGMLLIFRRKHWL